MGRSKVKSGTHKKLTEFSSNKMLSKSLTSGVPITSSSDSSESSASISDAKGTASLKPKMAFNRDESLMNLMEPDSTLALKQKSEVIQGHLQYWYDGNCSN